MENIQEDFINYLKEHPDERLWQALRNWSGHDFIFAGNLSNRLGGTEHAIVDGVKTYVKDTFYFGGKES